MMTYFKLGQSFLLKLVLPLCFLFFTNKSHAQIGTFDDVLNSALQNKPSKYVKIDSMFNSFERDSLRMKRFLEVSKANDYDIGASYALNALGIIQRNISNYDKSISLHESAKEYAEKSKSDELYIISLNMIGVVYRRMDIIKPALDFHTRALEAAYAVTNPSPNIKYNIAVSQNSIGNIYLALQQYDLALEQFKKSLKIEEELGNKLGLAINYHNIGYAEEAKGNLETALDNYEKSLGFNNEINSDIGRVICNTSIAGVYIKQKKYEAAKPIIEEALTKAINLGDQFYIASSYINLGQLQLGMNNINEAETTLKKALEISEEFRLNSSIAESNRLLSEISETQNNYDEALQYFQEAVAIEKTILTEKNLRYVNDIVVDYENELKNNQIKALASEKEAIMQRLEQNKKLFWYFMVALVLIAIVLIIVNRTRTLKREKHILTLEQDMLRSQMNPHFIFNTLNSIKLYIINNEKVNAVFYLNKFSKLIRKILMASKEKDTSLHEELETMKIYMTIENIRFSNEIDFQVNVDESINTEPIRVPSLILQPFLENALWHGLSSKKENKKIELNVKPNSKNSVKIEILDNGIGRKASGEINKNKRLQRKSVGIELTKARLANFSKAFNSGYTLNIEDLYKNDKPSGTKVTLQIPTTYKN